MRVCADPGANKLVLVLFWVLLLVLSRLVVLVSVHGWALLCRP